MKKIFALPLLLVTVMACNDQPAKTEADTRTNGFTVQLKTREDSLYHDVMEGHDIGMAKMGNLSAARTKVKKALDSLSQLPAAAQKKAAAYKTALDSLAEQLAYAEEGMMRWMRGFKTDSAKGQEDKRLEYLESEKVKVEKVRDNILETLQKVDSLVK